MLCSYRCGHQALTSLYQVILGLRELEPNVVSEFMQQALGGGVFEVHSESYQWCSAFIYKF